MLDPYIIEWLRREEERRRRWRPQAERPRLELPLDAPFAPDSPADDGYGSEVVIIDLLS